MKNLEYKNKFYFFFDLEEFDIHKIIEKRIQELYDGDIKNLNEPDTIKKLEKLFDDIEKLPIMEQLYLVFYIFSEVYKYSHHTKVNNFIKDKLSTDKFKIHREIFNDSVKLIEYNDDLRKLKFNTDYTDYISSQTVILLKKEIEKLSNNQYIINGETCGITYIAENDPKRKELLFDIIKSAFVIPETDTIKETVNNSETNTTKKTTDDLIKIVDNLTEEFKTLLKETEKNNKKLTEDINNLSKKLNDLKDTVEVLLYRSYS